MVSTAPGYSTLFDVKSWISLCIHSNFQESNSADLYSSICLPWHYFYVVNSSCRPSERSKQGATGILVKSETFETRLTSD